MKVLVTGGAGFIGSHLVDELVAKGHDVVVLDNLSTGRLSNIQGHIDEGRVSFERGSVLEPGDVRRVMEGVDRVFHLAASVGVQRVVNRPLESLINNISGSEIVLRCAAEHGVDKLILFSSSEVYGKAADRPLCEEDDSVLGASTVSRWGYAASKAVDEFLALAYHEEKDLPVVIVRCFNTCGPRQVGHYGMVIPRLVQQALAGETLTVFGDGEQSRCFSYVGDVVRGVLMLAESDEAVGQVFNIGTDSEVTILELAERIRSVTNSASDVSLVPYADVYTQAFEDIRRRVPDLSKIESVVGYRPEVGLDALLARIVEHERNDAANELVDSGPSSISPDLQ